jgi:integrase
MSLSDVAVRNAKPRERSFKLPDGEGMYLFVHSRGGKSFRLDYRHHGKRLTITLGAYPETTLAEARNRRHEAKKQLAQGMNPSHEKKMERVKAQIAADTTFSGVGKALMELWRREGQAANTLGKKEWLMGQLDRMIGNRPINAIEPPELLVALRTVEKKGNYETTKRLRIIAGQVFRYAIASGLAQRDPTRDLRGALVSPKVKHHAAVTKPDGIGALLRAIDGYGGNASTVVALQLAPLVFLRPGELRQLEWAEVDLQARCLRISEKKMKLRREHRVPLSRQALALIEEIRPFSARSAYVFPSVSNLRRPLSENTLNAAIRRLGYDKTEMTSHGFRTTASTCLHESGLFRSEVIELQLAHLDANAIRRIYNAAEYWDERVQMMEYWADRLDEMRMSRPLATLRAA